MYQRAEICRTEFNIKDSSAEGQNLPPKYSYQQYHDDTKETLILILEGSGKKNAGYLEENNS